MRLRGKTMVEGWRNGFREATNSKPLFLTIYATVIIGVLVSSFYVFSAIYSPTNGSTSWLSSPPLSTAGRIHQLPQENATFQLPVAPPLQALPPPAPEEAQGKSLGKIWVSPPRDKKMPPLESFKLTKELFGERVKDNVIIVTFGNYAFMDFILTWVKHLTDLDLSNILVGAMDTKLLEALYWKGVPVFDMGSHMSTVDVGWGSPTFHKMGREKVILIDSVLPYGYELLMCDTDMVWLKNPLPYLARYPDADVLTSSDQVVPTVVDDSLDIWQQGTEGKRHRLREGMVFYDPPEYYDAPGGFISFKPSIPKSLLLDGKHTIESHFALVNHQMKQIRSALDIASLLNRTLVMPPIWCRLGIPVLLWDL